MIVKQYLSTRNDGVKLFITYSDAFYKIKQQQTGKIYDEAIDVEDSEYTYEETDVSIDEEASESDYINALESLGVNFNG